MTYATAEAEELVKTIDYRRVLGLCKGDNSKIETN